MSSPGALATGVQGFMVATMTLENLRETFVTLTGTVESLALLDVTDPDTEQLVLAYADIAKGCATAIHCKVRIAAGLLSRDTEGAVVGDVFIDRHGEETTLP